MPPIRTPLASISTNRKRGIELTPYQRGQIIGLNAAGQSIREIQDQLGLSRNAVRGTIERQKSRPDGLSAPRCGHPPKYTDRETRSMIRCVRIHPKMTFAERRAHCDTEMSNSHIKNICREIGLSHWRAKKRPELSEKNARTRYEWCRNRAHWTPKMWERYMFSDECSVERGTGKKQVWVFGQPKDKWKPEMVETYTTGKNLKIMVWAMFWGSERSTLYIICRLHLRRRQVYY